MFQKTFEVSENPRITIEDCVGNLNIKVSEANIVTVSLPDDEDTLVFDQDGDVIILTIKDNAAITCPVNSTLNLITTRGNLKVKGIEGDVKIGTVNGNTDLRSVGALTMETGHGSLRLKSCAGAVDVGMIKGSARVQKITGSFKLGNLGGSLRAAGLKAGMVAEAVGADARISPPYTPGESYTLTVGSDLVIELPDEPNLKYTITAGGSVKSNAPDVDIVQDGGTAVGSMGEGEASIVATVGGSAVLRSSSESDSEDYEDFNFNFDFDFDPATFAFFEDLGPMIEATVNKAMSKMDSHLQEGLKYFDSDEFKAKMEKVSEKAKRAAERVERQAEGVADRARRQAEHAAERAHMRAQRAERRWQRASGQRSTEAPPPHQATVDEKKEERLRILRMVEDGKITSDEAAKLLTALS